MQKCKEESSESYPEMVVCWSFYMQWCLHFIIFFMLKVRTKTEYDETLMYLCNKRYTDRTKMSTKEAE